MIGKPQWFTRRKYSGWGFSPKTWQGWLYLLIVVIPFIVISRFAAQSTVGMIAMITWAIICIFDFVHIAMNIQKDERERMHEAIAERNALWVILAVLGAGIAYQTASTVGTGGAASVDPVIIIALGAALVTKIISNIYLDKRD